jgi:hypothetical protein
MMETAACSEKAGIDGRRGSGRLARRTRVISRWWSGLTAAVVGRGAYLMSVCATTWHRLQFPSEPREAVDDGQRSTVKLRDLTSRSGAVTVWPVQWVEPPGRGGTAVVPEAGVLEGLTRLGGRLLLRINVNGHRRTASLEWDSPPAVGDVEAVLQANLGAEMRVLGQLDLPIRREMRSPSPGRAPAGPRTSRRPPRR